MNFQKVCYENEELNIEINCYINKKNEIWFRGKEIALILGYKDTKKAIKRHVHEEDKIFINSTGDKNSPITGDKNSPIKGDKNSPIKRDKNSPIIEMYKNTRKCYFINESGFYSLIFSSNLPIAKEFKHWVTSKVLPSIRKRGYYDITNKKMIIENEFDLHCKVVDFIRKKISRSSHDCWPW